MTTFFPEGMKDIPWMKNFVANIPGDQEATQQVYVRQCKEAKEDAHRYPDMRYLIIGG